MDFVKLDVEGAELSVLYGAMQLLRRAPRPAILAEVHDIRTAAWGYPAREIIQFLVRMDFRWFVIAAKGALLPINCNEETYNANLVAPGGTRGGVFKYSRTEVKEVTKEHDYRRNQVARGVLKNLASAAILGKGSGPSRPRHPSSEECSYIVSSRFPCVPGSRERPQFNRMKVLVTGSSGLIGSEAAEHFDRQGHEVTGVDNNMRRVFFGPAGDTLWNLERLKGATKRFTHAALDIRDRAGIEELFRKQRFDLIVHCAAQPSHDKARDIPLLDFEVNALGTVNLLEATRQHSPEAVFAFLSTNKVYGDAPNEIPLKELEKRYDYARVEDIAGVDETCRIDRTMHSLFGASKAAADLVAQEYGRYFKMNVGVFRGGCLTGPSHSGVELHGFLSYLVKVTLNGGTYSIFGYKGKQVRDNIHSYDVVRAVEEFAANPRPGEVYNLGGGRENSISMLEAIERIELMTGRKLDWRYVEEARKGDHICYISNLGKFKKDYPNWKITRGLDLILEEIIASQREQLKETAGS